MHCTDEFLELVLQNSMQNEDVSSVVKMKKVCLTKFNRPAAALKIHEAMISYVTSLHGAQSPETVTQMFEKAVFLSKIGQCNELFQLHCQILDTRVVALGNHHKDKHILTLMVAEILVTVYCYKEEMVIL